MAEVEAKGVPTFGKTPEGQIVGETPGSLPVNRHSTWGVWSNWLGDPETRYGRRRNTQQIPTWVKVEMLNDPVIGLCMGFLSAKLVNAEYEILCADEDKRRFFEAMYNRVHQEFMLQAAPAIALGFLGMVKKFKFEVPQPLDPKAPPVWQGQATPFILTGFDQIYPTRSKPIFDDNTREFKGIDCSAGRIDVFYSLWLTIGKALAFGAYEGRGRLLSVYGDWWLKQFARDLYVVHLQRNIDRVVKMGYPPGKDIGGKSFRDHALEIGDDIRAGATVALPTTMYTAIDATTGEEKLTNVRKWTAEFMEGAENVGAFNEMDDHFDQKMSLGMLVPPQVYLNVRQSALGGPTTATVLGELAVDLLLIDAVTVDTHLNKYVFPIVDKANFPPGSPPVEKRTTGLVDKDRQEIMEIIRVLLQQPDSEVASIFDVRRALARLGLPMREVVAEPTAPSEPESDEENNDEGLQIALDQKQNTYDVPRDVLEQLATAELPDDLDEAVEVTPADLRRVVRLLKDEIPELFDVETV